MPKYSYHCSKCEEEVEMWYGYGDAVPAKFQCDCGGVLARYFKAPSVHNLPTGAMSKPRKESNEQK